MAVFNKLNKFVEALAEKVHNLGSDQLKIALTNTAPAVTDGVLADLTEIAYTNLSSRDLTVSGSAQTDGTYKLSITDLVLTASGGAVAGFRYIYIYNDTASGKELIGYYDYGSVLDLADGDTFTVDFDDADGVLTLV